MSTVVIKKLFVVSPESVSYRDIVWPQAPFLNSCRQGQIPLFSNFKHHLQGKWMHYNTLTNFFFRFLLIIQWNSIELVMMCDSSCGLATDWRIHFRNPKFLSFDCVAFYLPESVIIFRVQLHLSEESRLKHSLCFHEFVPSPFCEGATSGRSTWACSEPSSS